ncbi:MAG: GDP-mannose 4,6-dehydratase [Candidatus Bathyarchaeota archaeon]|nr:GDP-mannose 4,6-dehydratase [Candidatus Bathyarchaeota archaeon]
METKKALITGITGQDGSYLAEFLLSKGYEVHGIIRRASTFNTGRIDHIYSDPHERGARLFLHYGDVSDSEQTSTVLSDVAPGEIYHLGAQSHVKVSFSMPEYTGNVTGLGTVRLLESIRRSCVKSKFYQASSSEMFGRSPSPQNEETPFSPTSPYAVAKVYAFWMAKNYRLGYNMFACNGILFNHESPRRGEVFVTRKITMAIASILAKKQEFLYLGNMEPKRDWGYAPEYVEVMWKILQQEVPDDFVVGTGEQHSVKEFVNEAFAYVGLDSERHTKTDSRYFRPTETDDLAADAKKIKKVTKWEAKVRFKDLVKIMIDADMRRAGLKPIGEGDAILQRKFPDKWWSDD